MRRSLGIAVLVLGSVAAAQADVEALVQRLGGADARHRSEAYSELQRTHPAEALPLLGKRIAGFPLDGQHLAGYLLQQYPIADTRPIYRRLLQQDGSFLRAIAAAALYRAGDRDVVEALSKALMAVQDRELDLALSRVYGIGEPSVTAAVRGRLQPGVSAMAAETALYHLLTQVQGADPATRSAAEGLLADGEVRIRAAALAWLVATGCADRGAALLALLREQPNLLPSLQRFLERAPRLDEALLELLQQRLAAARNQYEVNTLSQLLRHHAVERAGAALRELLSHDDEAVRTAALTALSSIPGALDDKQLRAMLASGQDEQVLLAAGILRRMDDDSGCDAVLAIVRGGRATAKALAVLGAFRRRAVVTALIDALGDADQLRRQAAWQALQQLLPDMVPYRRLDMGTVDYRPEAPAGQRAAAVEKLRAFWQAVQ